MNVHVLASGSTGNAVLVDTGDVRLMIDAGLSSRRLTQKLHSVGVDPQTIDALLITHEHSDHVKGVEVFSRHYQIPVYARPETWQAMERIRTKMKPEYRFDLGDALCVRQTRVTSFATSHDAADPVGYCVYHDSVKLGVATDLGFMTDAAQSSLTDCDLLILESNHDVDMLKNGNYPWHLKQRILSNRGHLSNDAAGWGLTKILTRAKTRVFLAHLSQENNMPELALHTVENILQRSGFQVGADVELKLTYPDAVSSWYVNDIK